MIDGIKRGNHPVTAGKATEWCARMVVVVKMSGKSCRTVDFQKLHACCLRETHNTPASFDMESDIPPRTHTRQWQDTHWGFHQVKLVEASRCLITFITPWGHYQYCCTQMDHCSPTDAFTKWFDDAIWDLPRKHRCIDDTLLYDANEEEAFWSTHDFLELCIRKGITFKLEKFKFCCTKVEFVGFNLGY